jgi:glycosyltransferase involved in cell wall biosynthesis
VSGGDDGLDLLAGRRRGPLGALWHRIVLTWRHHGPLSVALRIATYPLRATPLRRHLGVERIADERPAMLRRWHALHGRPVTILAVCDAGAAEFVERLLASVAGARSRHAVRIVLSAEPAPAAQLDADDGVEIVGGGGGREERLTRAMGSLAGDTDVIVLEPETALPELWLERLQAAALRSDAGVTGPLLLAADGTIASAGVYRSAPSRFAQRYRSRPGAFGPAGVTTPVLALAPGCLYVRAELAAELDPALGRGEAEIDLCLRSWRAGRRVVHAPVVVAGAAALQPEAGVDAGARLRRRWGEFFDTRPVRTADGRLRVVYVTEDTIVGGGHRDIFEHLNGLAARGHDVALYTLGGQPDWFDLRAPVRSFATYGALAAELGALDAIKVATWWNTAETVWLASVDHGVPVYFVQDIETSYYPDDERRRNEVLASYKPEFSYVTISGWNAERLRELGCEATLIAPGIDLATFRPRPEISRRADVVLALGRSHPLKNLGLTLAAWRALDRPRPELRLFGGEPELARGAGIVYERRPSDQRVGELFCEASVFVQTSTHEGFCLPVLEAMACGTPVVCTDAHGNRDFCLDGQNCLMPEASTAAVAAAIGRVLRDPELAARLAAAGLETAAAYRWELRIDQLEERLEQIARAGRFASAQPLASHAR